MPAVSPYHQTGECEAAQQYVRQLEDVLAHSAPKAGVAAFIAEYIQVWEYNNVVSWTLFDFEYCEWVFFP